MAPFGNYYLISTENESETKAVEQIVIATAKIRGVDITQQTHTKSRQKIQPWWLAKSGKVIAKNYSEAMKFCSIIDAKVLKMNSKAPKSKKRN